MNSRSLQPLNFEVYAWVISDFPIVEADLIVSFCVCNENWNLNNITRRVTNVTNVVCTKIVVIKPPPPISKALD